MSKSKKKVAALQLASGSNVSANLLETERLAEAAAKQGAELIVLPENFAFMGRSCGDANALREAPGDGPLQSFLSQLASRLGQFTGLPEHADRLLRDDRLLMVFPEGARGTAKLARDADSLVRFGTGFMRLALKTGTPIVPVAFVGGGEAIPTVMNLYKLGQFLGVPYIPVTPYLFPLPKPVKLQLLYSEPLVFEGDGSEADEVIHGYVEQVRSRIAWLIEQARALRAGTLKPEELELR